MSQNIIKIATWNVNSVKSRIEHLLEYLRSDQAPDILGLQELKCLTDQFPYMEIEDAGYNVIAHGQKTYNGVAILSKYPIDEHHHTMPGDAIDHDQARFIESVISIPHSALRIVNLYVPNGQSPDSDKFKYKMAFYDALYDYAKTLISLDEKTIILGDFNVAPDAMDVFDPVKLDGTVCYHPKEREKLKSILHLGFTDIFRAHYPNQPQYSWWDYRAGAWNQNKGLRIDHLLLSPQAADYSIDAGVDMFMRSKDKPSDHAPVWCKLSW